MGKKILLIGASGFLGLNWLYYNKSYEIIPTYSNSLPNFKNNWVNFTFDGSNILGLLKLITEVKPDVVINCAALKIEECELNKEYAKIVNVTLPKHLALISKNLGLSFVQISTDHFYSKFDFPRSELETVIPLNMYGETKICAEKIILELNPRALIIRVNFFGYGLKKKINLLDDILTCVKSGKNFMGYTDTVFSPVSISELVKCTYLLLDLGAGGIFNLASGDSLSKLEFAKAVCRIFEYNPELVISSLSGKAEVNVRRVKYLALGNAKFSSFTGVTIPTVEEMLLELKSDIVWQQEVGGLNV